MMGHKAQYGVKFVGYLATVIVRKYGRELEYASLDFVTGMASVHAQWGWVSSMRLDLGPFVKNLRQHASELQQLLAQRAARGIEQSAESRLSTSIDRKMVTLSCGKSDAICVSTGTNVNKFIRQITKRFLEIERVVEQAEQVGSRIKRRPYSEYIDEIAKTGICRVEGHGFGLFVNGRLIFYPNYQVALVRQAGENSFEVHPLETTNIESHN